MKYNTELILGSLFGSGITYLIMSQYYLRNFVFIKLNILEEFKRKELSYIDSYTGVRFYFCSCDGEEEIKLCPYKKLVNYIFDTSYNHK